MLIPDIPELIFFEYLIKIGQMATYGGHTLQ